MATERPARLPNLTIENAQIYKRNFSGEKGIFNAEGDRNFLLRLDEELAAALKEAGWNVKRHKPGPDTAPDELPGAFVSVKVNLEGPRPARIYLISSRGRTLLGPNEMLSMDVGDFSKVDLIINPYQWHIEETGGTGIKPYLVTLYATLVENELDKAYSDVPDSSALASARFVADNED